METVTIHLSPARRGPVTIRWSLPTADRNDPDAEGGERPDPGSNPSRIADR